MTNFLLISGMILLYTLQSLFCKLYTDKYPGRKEAATPVFIIVNGITVAVVSVLLTGFRFNFSWQVLLIGLLNGVALMFYDSSLIGASQQGPYSILMVFMIAGGIIVPAVVSAIFFNVEMSVWKALCIIIVLISVWLVSKKSGETYKNKKKFFIYCTILGLCNGIYGTCLKWQEFLSTSGVIKEASKELVAITYITAVIIAFTAMLIRDKKAALKDFTTQNKSSLIFLILCSVIASVAINLFVFIIPLVDINVLNTLDNAMVFLLSVICSCIFFKEKLSVVNVVGCIMMTAALIGVTLL